LTTHPTDIANCARSGSTIDAHARSDDPGHNSGYDDGLTPANIERAGVAALVRKPIEPSVLLAVLEKHLQRPITAQ
jgi:hypothetical protein